MLNSGVLDRPRYLWAWVQETHAGQVTRGRGELIPKRRNEEAGDADYRARVWIAEARREMQDA